MAVTTIRGLNKIAAAQFLKSKGYIVWRCFSPLVRVYSLIIIACNKLNPDDPYKAYKYLSHELHRLSKQSHSRVADRATLKQERVDLLRRELAMMTTSPWPGGPEWPEEYLPPELGDHIALPPEKS